MAQLAYETECSWWCVAISQKILAESAPKSSSSACRASICKQIMFLDGFQGKNLDISTFPFPGQYFFYGLQ